MMDGDSWIGVKEMDFLALLQCSKAFFGLLNRKQNGRKEGKKQLNK